MSLVNTHLTIAIRFFVVNREVGRYSSVRALFIYYTWVLLNVIHTTKLVSQLSPWKSCLAQELSNTKMRSCFNFSSNFNICFKVHLLWCKGMKAVRWLSNVLVKDKWNWNFKYIYICIYLPAIMKPSRSALHTETRSIMQMHCRGS